jgi:subtilisin-like proprotein convertase family protein
MQNAGTIDTTNLVATLLPSGGVTGPSGPMSYGVLLAGGSAATNAFTFTANGSCGSAISVTLQVQDGDTDLGNVTYPFTLGGIAGTMSSNLAPGAISIPSYGNAFPYPSTQLVSGLAGSIENVSVTLLGFSHTFPDDLDILLVNPAGQSVVLMSGAGGAASMNGINLTFDDTAATFLPDETVITDGTYKPSRYFDPDFPRPPPRSPYGTTMSALNGSSPNGVWKLFVVDANPEDAGTIASGWRLNIAAGLPFCCASNQPPVFTAISNRTVTISNNLIFAVTAVDESDDDAITLTASNLPPGAVFGVTNGNGTFSWISAQPLGVYTTGFYAADINGTVSENIRITVNPAPIAYTTNYIVTFEGDGETKLFYSTSNATLSGRTWTLNETRIGTSSSDHKNGARAARMRDTDSVMTMESDVNRIDAVRFYHARYGSDSNSAVALDYSTNAGSAWINAGTVTVSSTTLTLYQTNITVAGSVRIRFRKTAGSSDNIEANIDDITLLVDGSPPQSPPVLIPIGAKSVYTSNTLTFAISAIGTDGDPVTLSISNAPPGTTLGFTNIAGTFTWPLAAPAGVYTTRFFAADNDGSVSETVIITVTNLTGGGSETFIHLNASPDNYTSGSYIGDGNVLWNYRGATLPEADYFIEGQSIGFGNSVIGDRDLVSEAIPGGIGNLSVKYMKHFTGAGSRAFEIHLNDVLVGTVDDANNTLPATATFSGINLHGPVVIKLVSIGSSQIVIDSLTWTGFVDDDGDGLLDLWEILHFGGLTNANMFTDSDADFVSDHHEFLAGTQPTNAASYLQVADSRASSEHIVIQWPGVIGKSYALSRTTNVISYLYSVIASNIAGIEPLNTYTDEAPPAAGSVYRIELEK